jgi:multimeric flavodoxin WrbA
VLLSTKGTFTMKRPAIETPKFLPEESRPFVLIASSRSNGHTAALVNAAFPDDAGAIVDISARQIGYYSYTNQSAGDDFIPVVERGLRHPLWVVATPLYWYTMSAQAKTFLDRLSDLLEFRKDLGRQLRGKYLAVLCTGTDAAEPPHFAEPFELTANYLGMRYLGQHYAQLVDGAPMSTTQREVALQFSRDLASQSKEKSPA